MVNPPFSQDEWNKICHANQHGQSPYAPREWLLEKLTPTDPFFWTGFLSVTSYRIELLAKITGEMGNYHDVQMQ
jgi:hypothetical protein